MAVWEKGTPVTGLEAGDRIDIDGSGPIYVRVLSPKFRGDDGDEFCIIGYGTDVIVPVEYFEE